MKTLFDSTTKLDKFTDLLYYHLRTYQDGNLRGRGTVVGRLDQPLTELYDNVVAAAKTHLVPQRKKRDSRRPGGNCRHTRRG